MGPFVSFAQAQIFFDNMSNSANWTIRQDADTSFQFGCNYSQDGLPPAPSGSGDTIGLKFEVNNNFPGAVNQIAAVRFDSAYTGQYTVRADIWLN